MRDSSIELSAFTLAVIAGGMGTRMGKPKAWLEIGGKSVLAYLLDRLNWQGPTMLVTAPAVPPPPLQDRFTAHVRDPVDGLGPLRGVLTALEHCSTPALVAIAVDMPLVESTHLHWLCEQLTMRATCLGVMGEISSGADRHIEPFPAAFRVGAADAIAERLSAGRRSLYRLCDDDRFSAIEVSADVSAEAWINLNDPAGLAAFERVRR